MTQMDADQICVIRVICGLLLQVLAGEQLRWTLLGPSQRYYPTNSGFYVRNGVGIAVAKRAAHEALP